MSGGTYDTSHIDPGLAILNILLVALFAVVGGFLTSLLGGFKCPCGPCKGKGWGNLLGKVTIPLLVGMIVFGCIGRNVLPTDLTEHYNDIWAGYIRMVCLGVILLRGGMELEFAGKGITVVLLTLVPQIIEASAVAIAAYLIIGLPFILCYALGFILGAVSPAILVPSCMIL